MKTKICSKCCVEKPISNFCKDKAKKDGLSCSCRLCCSKRNKKYNKDHKEQKDQYYQNNIKQILENRKNHYKENEESIKQYNKNRYQNNTQQIREQQKEYYQDNKEIHIAKAAKREAIKLNQMPKDADKQAIEQLYKICSEKNDSSIYFHVDHIQPLSKGGLHHQDNLQILEAKLNLEKGSKWPLTDKEQIRYTGLRLEDF